MMNKTDFTHFRTNTLNALLNHQLPQGHFLGELSSSALSTATAVVALAQAEKYDTRYEFHNLIKAGLDWLAAHQNKDGGWGDTTISKSNISTTALVWSAFAFAPDEKPYRSQIEWAEHWLLQKAGGLTPYHISKTIIAKYQEDRTFSAPILSMCAISGRFGQPHDAWSYVHPLPYELAVFPQTLYNKLNLQVVSYALPALIAIGQGRACNRPSKNPVTRLIRKAATPKTRRILQAIQPESGGYLEAIPLTSFVIMNLIAAGIKPNEPANSVIENGIGFLKNTVRDDGCWAIDINLATWLTTLSVNALSCNPQNTTLTDKSKDNILNWLTNQQFKTIHPYTHAAPGGWGWTDCSGSVPDADDTAGALIALKNLTSDDQSILPAIENGINWLLDLQNRDGGVPTFCKGWQNLPFDQSGADLTAHALHAIILWKSQLTKNMQLRCDTFIDNALSYLQKIQDGNGSWQPLWFGNENSRGETNLIYGTSRTLLALSHLRTDYRVRTEPMWQAAIHFLITRQKDNGGWTGGTESADTRHSLQAISIEETAIAVTALAHAYQDITLDAITKRDVRSAILEGINSLKQQTQNGTTFPPAPIGFYFASLWYYEQLYPIIFTVSALESTLASSIISDSNG